MWDFPEPGIEPVSPALAGGFLSTVPSGKSSEIISKLRAGLDPPRTGSTAKPEGPGVGPEEASDQEREARAGEGEAWGGDCEASGRPPCSCHSLPLAPTWGAGNY